MRHISRFIQAIPPKTLIVLLYAISFWLIYGSIGQFAAVYPDLFSGEQVTNIW